MLDEVIRPSLWAKQASESDVHGLFEVTFKLLNVATETSWISFSEAFDKFGLYKVERRIGRLESGAPESSEEQLKAGIIEIMES